MAKTHHLHELLKEEQEPFVLQSYLLERRSLFLKQNTPKTLSTPNHNPTSFPHNLCKNHSFFPSSASPRRRKAPHFAALFLSPSTTYPHKGLGFSFLASILRRISSKKKAQKPEIRPQNIAARLSVKDILRWNSFSSLQRPENCWKIPSTVDEKELSDLSSHWSRDSDEKSASFGSHCSSSSGSELFEEAMLETPVPVLAKDSVSGDCTPAMSPLRRKDEVKEREMIQQGNIDGGVIILNKEEEDQKEQFSPVSVLDVPFVDDEVDVHEYDSEFFEKSFTNVLRVKQNLLSRIQMFERLAELDTLELGKRIAKEEEEECGSINGNEEEEDEEECCSINGNEEIHEKEVEPLFPFKNEQEEQFVREVERRANSYMWKFSTDMRQLALDLAKEKMEGDMVETDIVAKVCRRIESWKDVTLNTIDMTVLLDCKREGNKWQRHCEEVKETAEVIEVAVFDLLVEELWIDLAQPSSLQKQCL